MIPYPTILQAGSEPAGWVISVENSKPPEQDGRRQNKAKFFFLGILILTVILIVAAGPLLTVSAPSAGSTVAMITIDASPRNYSLCMSSVPGMGLTPNVTGIRVADLEYRWNTSFGFFESWSESTGYRVIDLGSPVSNNGETVYWNFYNGSLISPPSEPITITLSVKDRKTGALIGTSDIRVAIIDNLTTVVVE